MKAEIQKIIDERVGEETNKAIEREMESAVNKTYLFNCECLKKSWRVSIHVLRTIQIR